MAVCHNVPDRTTAERSIQKSYRGDIDGLRALAILSVVLYHAGVPLLSGGFAGVDVFFVISGYLIGAHVYADLQGGRFTIGEFYRKRAKRILPALLALLAVCYLAALLLLSPVEIVRFGSYTIATLLSGSNIYAFLKSNYFAAAADQNPLLMTWSLGVEEQFYIFFPLLMLALAKVRRRTLFFAGFAITACSIIICLATTPRNPSAAFYLLPARAWELAVGVLLAIYENNRHPATLYGRQRYANAASVAGLLLIALAVFGFNAHTAFPGYAALAPVAGAALLLISPTSWVNRSLLSAPPMRWIGLVSYSFYLWHWPLLSFAHIASDKPISAALGCELCTIALGAAWLSYKFVEQPFRHSRMASRPLLLRYALLSLIAAVPALAIRHFSGLPQRFPDLARIDAGPDSIQHTCAGETSPDLSAGCVNVTDPRPAVALIGDSHAGAIAPAIRQLAGKSGYKLYEFIKFSCAPLVGVTRELDTRIQEQECVRYNEQVRRRIETDPGIKVVVLSAYWAGPAIDNVPYLKADQFSASLSPSESDAHLAEGLDRALKELRASGKRVVVVDDVPVFRFDPVSLMRSQAIPARAFASRLLGSATTPGSRSASPDTQFESQRRISGVLAKVTQANAVDLFNPRPNLCAQTTCTFAQGKTPLYGDRQHVTPVGASAALKGVHLM